MQPGPRKSQNKICAYRSHERSKLGLSWANQKHSHNTLVDSSLRHQVHWFCNQEFQTFLGFPTAHFSFSFIDFKKYFTFSRAREKAKIFLSVLFLGQLFSLRHGFLKEMRLTRRFQLPGHAAR